MTATHYFVFVGAGPSLSTELRALKSRFNEIEIIAPAVGKHERGLTTAAVKRALCQLIRALRSEPTQSEPARLSVWSYEPLDVRQFGWLWSAFGKSAWIELVPSTLTDKDRPTRVHIQTRLGSLRQLIHSIAHEVYNSRRKSPLPLPLRNFRHELVHEFTEYWYRDVDLALLKRSLEKSAQRFRQLRSNDGS